MTENLNLGGGKDGHVEVWEVEAVAEHSTRTGHRARQPGRGNSSKEQRVAGGVLAKVSIREEGGGGEEDGEVLLVVGERYSAAGKRGGRGSVGARTEPPAYLRRSASEEAV